jgi:pimeloyl-ACP methyl ester carboxylesterase
VLRSSFFPGVALLHLVSTVAAQESLVGHWEGDITDGARAIRTSLHLALDEEGALSGTCDSPDQGVFGLALAELSFDEPELSFRVPDTNGAWDGRLAEDGRLVGTWRQRGAELELDLERVEPDPLVGTWEGVGDFGSLKLRLVFHVGTRSDGSLGASLVSPDQSPAHVPASRVAVGEDGLLHIEIPTIGASYEGRPDDAAMRIEGHLSQAGGRFPLDLDRAGVPAPLRRPQTPEPPFPYRALEVTFENPAAGNRLAGTLTLPGEGGPFPAVVLITGSGQQNRDEELFGHRPFLVIADALTRAGIAVLRCDDRGVGGSTGDVAGATSEDFAGDVSAAIDFLRTRAEIRADRIGLLGHSEGGLIAPLVATRRDDVAFLVLLAGPGIPGDEILYLQAALLARAAGSPEPAIEANRLLQERLFSVLRTVDDPAEARAKLHEILVGARSEGASQDAALQAELAKVSSPWFRFFVRHDPAPVLRHVTCPVLALNGDLDLQVPARENLQAIAEALEAAGNTDFRVVEYPGLNHLFQHATLGSVSEYAEIEETISPEVLRDITAWILER